MEIKNVRKGFIMDDTYKKGLTKRIIKSNGNGNTKSFEEVKKIINDQEYCILSNKKEVRKGVNVLFFIDNLKIDENKLIFGRDNSSEIISFELNDFKYKKIFVDDNSMFFILNNDEEWNIMLKGEIRTHYRPHENCSEIELDFFLNELRHCKEIGFRILEHKMSVSTGFNSITINDSYDYDEWLGEDRQVNINFRKIEKRKGSVAFFDIDLSDCMTKFFRSLEIDSYFYICLPDKPFSELELYFYYK